MIHYHGTPITPRIVLESLAGRHFCVSYARPDSLAVCHRIAQSIMLDNGAFSAWRNGTSVDWDAWRAWIEAWESPSTWCVLPDVIDGTEADNDELLLAYGTVRNGWPVWHLHESLERLVRLVRDHGRVCFGSSKAYAKVGTPQWHRRVSQAFDQIADWEGRVPPVHMLRGMSLSGDIYPFASVDSSDVGQNHARPQNTALEMVERWDALQVPIRWTRDRQLALSQDLTIP